jgi:hypothetical protein
MFAAEISTTTMSEEVFGASSELVTRCRSSPSI